MVAHGEDRRTAAVAERLGVRFVQSRPRRRANASRNAGIDASRGDPVVLIDDDVEAPPGWLDALLRGVAGAPERDVFGGPIHARLEGGGPRACGREPAPITTLELGAEDRDVPLVWSANMAIRRRAFERVGRFDETHHGRGEEEDWERRYAAQGGRIRYLADAGLDHRRTAADATVRKLARAAYAPRAQRAPLRRPQGRRALARARAADAGRCLWHILRRRCAIGIVMAAQAAGRLREALESRRRRDVSAGSPTTSCREPTARCSASAPPAGRWRSTRCATRRRWRACSSWRLRRAAARWPRRRVLALGVEREGVPNLLAAARAELERCRHEVAFASTFAGDRGKFENLNALLAEPAAGHDWLLVVDDDVELPRGFLDAFVFLAERFGLRLAQPAHRWRSTPPLAITRRRAGSVARETAFVEIGPVTAFHADTFCDPAAVPAAAGRLGAGRPLGGGRRRARLADRGRRRNADPPRPAPDRLLLRPRRGDRGGARVPRRAALHPSRESPADARLPPRLAMKVLIVAEATRASRAGAGDLGPPQALAARDAGASSGCSSCTARCRR